MPSPSPSPSRTSPPCGAETIDLIDNDILQNIVARLPAHSFASAACVSRSWNLVCDRVLCRPKLSSACSFNSSLQVAVEDVVSKVLLEPIRPHFAIASVSPFDLHMAHKLITVRLGSKVPVFTNVSSGIMGRDAISDEFKEIQWEVTEEVDSPDEDLLLSEDANRGIMLIVGFLPGIKVKAIPLLQEPKAKRHRTDITNSVMIDKLLMDIWKCSTSVSGCRSPAAIIVFGGLKLKGMESYIKKIEHAMSPDTVVVGDSCCQFMYSDSMGEYTSSAIGVALVFMVDKDKPSGMGETLFNAILSSRLSPVSPAYNIADAFVKTNYTWPGASATTKVSPEDIHAKTILDQVYDKVGCETTFYVGITKRRKCYIGQDSVETTFLAFHEFLGRKKNYLFVFGKDIKTGDSFRIYHANSDTAASSITSICDRSLSFKQGSITGDAKEVFGGIIFSPTFADPCVYSSPFLDNFPGVTLAGTFCGGLFGRGYSPSIEEGAVPCRMHKCSALYLVMSYTPPNRNQEFVGEKGGKEKCKQVAG